MPIKDGYEACSAILNYYEKIKVQVIQNQTQKDDWLTDLADLLDQYVSEDPDDQIDSTGKNELKMMKIFKKLFTQVRFRSLDLLYKPFIIAFSQLVNPEIE